MTRGKFKVSSTPSGFDIYVNDVKKAYHTPWTIGLPTGDYELTFKKEGYVDEHVTHTLEADEVIDISFTGEPTITPPPPPLPPPPPPPEKAFFSIGSDPAGGEIWIDDTYTGFFTWKPNIEVSAGRHKIEVKGIQGFVDTHIFRTAYAGETREITVAMAPTPPEAPPEVPPPEVPLEEQFQRPLSDFVASLGLAPPQWLIAWDDIVTWLTDMFGTEWPNWTRDAITGEIKKLPTGKKVLFFVSMPAPITAAQTAVQTAVAGMTASDILSMGLKDPKGLASLIKGLTKEQVSQLFAQLVKHASGRDAIQTIQRVVLDQRMALPKWKIVAGATGAGLLLYQLSHTLNYIGFLAEETIQTIGIGVFTLISNKLWKDAAIALPKYKQSVDIMVAGIDELTKVPVLSYFLNLWWPAYKAGAYAQIEAYDTTIKEGLKAEETGSISVETTPTGATIWVNDVQQKYASNSVIDKLIPATYTVRVELKGHVEHQEEAIAEVGVQTMLVHEFEPIPEKPAPGSGRIEWEAKDRKTGAPVGVSWYIDERLEKSFTTAWALDLTPDTYEMRWTAIGYEDYLDTVALEKDKTTVLAIELDKIELLPEIVPLVTCETLGYHTEKPVDGREYEQVPVRGLLCWAVKEPTKGTVEISSSPPAEVWLLGKKIAETTPLKRDFPQGFYTFVLKAEDYKDKTLEVWVYAGETTIRAVTLTPEEEPEPLRRLARVSVNSSPTGAKILVNGVWTKGYTPDSVLLEAGDYEIGLTKSGYKPWSTPLRLVEES